MATAIANRRKQLAQAIWLRARIDQHIAEVRDMYLQALDQKPRAIDIRSAQVR